MKVRNYGRWIHSGLVLLLLAGSGCTIKNKGTAAPNAAPRVFFSPVPLDSTLFTAPVELFWYALDGDGYIVEFQYSIQTDSVVQAAGGEAVFVGQNNPNTSPVWNWVSISNLFQNGQRAVVAFPASIDSTKIVRSVIFLRARDDQGAYSTDAWPAANSIVWRNFARKNRPPNTYISQTDTSDRRLIIPAGGRAFYSLDQSTFSSAAQVGHSGITFSWRGVDSADYPRSSPPPFRFYWELFGPFPDSASADSLPDSLYRSSSGFVTDTTVTFFGLRGFQTNIRPAIYLFQVRAVDDAGAIDATPRRLRFRVVHPTFDKRILLVRRTIPGGGIISGQPSVTVMGTSQAYYAGLLSQAGYPIQPGDTLVLPGGATVTQMPESLLARYQMVIYHKEEARVSSEAGFLAQLRRYMNIGGMVWGMGRADLSDLSPAWPGPGGLVKFDNNDPVTGIPFFYFGCDQLFFHAHVNYIINDSLSNEQSIGTDLAVPAGPADLPLLEVDTLVTKAYVANSRRKPNPFPYYLQMPEVNYFVIRRPEAEPLYLYRSAFPDTSSLHGKVVAVRWKRGPLRTAQFGFPLYGIKQPQAVEITKKMLDWFFDPNP